MKKGFLVFLWVFIFIPSFAYKWIGVVKDGNDKTALTFVEVQNLTQHTKASSDLYGRFSIDFKNGDSIIFNLNDYLPTSKKMDFTSAKPKDTLRDAVFLFMSVDTFSDGSDTVRITSKLSKYQIDSIDRYNTYKLPLNHKDVHGLLPSVFHPATALAQLFSAKYKSRRDFKKNFVTWEEEHYTDSRYSPELVTELTGLKGDSLGFFMGANPMPYDFSRVASEMEIKMWIRYHYREWIKDPTIPVVDTFATPINNK